MKKFFFSQKFVLATVAIFAALFFSKCTNAVSETNCDGYTGKVENKQALALQAKCHFMPKDTIAVWTERYQKNKPTIGTALPNASSILGDSCSFNNSIVRAIITNDNCIGLRVIYGMDENNKVHIILVGINPEYETLYIEKPKDCGEEKNAAAKDGSGGSGTGGAEYGMEP